MIQRLDATAAGHWGDCDRVGEGMLEKQIRTGSGYRVYTVRRGAVVYLLRCGGDKSTAGTVSGGRLPSPARHWRRINRND